MPARMVQRAFTLIEMMVVIALMAIIVMLAAPNMTEMIGMQRLRAINDQLATDFQYLRTEAVARNQFMGFLTRNLSGEPVSCYAIFSNVVDPLSDAALDRTQCNCSNAVGSACSSSTTHRELRTVQLPRDLSIELRFPTTQPNLVILSPISGGTQWHPSDTSVFNGQEFCVEVRRSPRGRLRTGIYGSGRTTVCSPDGSVPGVPVCPAYNAALANCQAIP